MKKETLKIIISLFVFVGVVLAGNQVLADADNNPIFPTFEQVRQMIADALGQSQVLPPFTSEIDDNLAYTIKRTPDEYMIFVGLHPMLMNQEFTGQPGHFNDDSGSSWGVAHLPSGDKIGIGYVGMVSWFIPVTNMPPEGTPIDVDIYTFYAGKTIHLNATITNWQ
ncbi:MAG: hypothetical protein A3H01_00150 [Candidatus Wildermuthbacteria bacterium RIFCSPLOWO2_12_FULL_40_9]|uniref:Uncharacterized protein n=2 Tax=Candidatus Wildermuthiibacteriota TaxID=1817923 RepID=A0A1G2REL9_9BACT|nr:MAG: hypothetical protein A3F15_01515 [Candidatus Wildermuthbacteria bacterium RIFCSPHIGHO2_12_FULL_40_12]OHA76156.1 MAG: hypothetical protein A3H01_00150 [Candidatus Wildermuthbacteria bacterium RIFCSPLOWO2_12_FULL_40_9]